MAAKSFVDANVILRHLLQDDPKYQKQADEVFEKATVGSLIITNVIVAEVVYIMRGKGYSRDQIVIGIEQILGRDCVNPSGLDTTRRTLQLYEAYPRLDFADCYLLARSLRTGKHIQSFDKDLQKVFRQLSS
jgi:predicted nucleic-acid-binding protein